MANSAINMYELSLDQCVSAIIAGGNKRTVLMQGHIGTGKSATLTISSPDKSVLQSPLHPNEANRISKSATVITPSLLKSPKHSMYSHELSGSNASGL